MPSVLQLKFQGQDNSDHGDNSYQDDDLYGDPILESEDMDLEKHQAEGLLDVHVEPLDKDDVAEHCKAWVLDIHHFPYQVGIGWDGEEQMVPVYWGMLGT